MPFYSHQKDISDQSSFSKFRQYFKAPEQRGENGNLVGHTFGAYKKFQNPFYQEVKCVSDRKELYSPTATPKSPEHVNRGIVEPATAT